MRSTTPRTSPRRQATFISTAGRSPRVVAADAALSRGSPRSSREARPPIPSPPLAVATAASPSSLRSGAQKEARGGIEGTAGDFPSNIDENEPYRWPLRTPPPGLELRSASAAAAAAMRGGGLLPAAAVFSPGSTPASPPHASSSSSPSSPRQQQQQQQQQNILASHRGHHHWHANQSANTTTAPPPPTHVPSEVFADRSYYYGLYTSGRAEQLIDRCVTAAMRGDAHAPQ